MGELKKCGMEQNNQEGKSKKMHIFQRMKGDLDNSIRPMAMVDNHTFLFYTLRASSSLNYKSYGVIGGDPKGKATRRIKRHREPALEIA